MEQIQRNLKKTNIYIVTVVIILIIAVVFLLNISF